jgi:hypothetical protein
MADSSPDDPAETDAETGADADSGADDPAGAGPAPRADRPDESEALDPGEVERRYDFEDFGPEQMREMSPDEWETAFDPDAWITGDRLLDRVHGELRARIATRDVFAVVEEVHEDGERRLIAYDDDGYALVYPDGTVEGLGTVLRDVKPTVALCSMESYEPDEGPENDALLPEPGDVPEQSGEFGNLMIQVVAAVFLLSGLALVVAWPVVNLPILTAVLGLFVLAPIGIFLFLTVANARLSDRFRAEEYRERLRAIGLEEGERPEFLPLAGDEAIDRESLADADAGGDAAGRDDATGAPSTPADAAGHDPSTTGDVAADDDRSSSSYE